MECLLYPIHTCDKCGCECKQDSPCPDWAPGRGSTPSTPNLCEWIMCGALYEEYPLCPPKECIQCCRGEL